MRSRTSALVGGIAALAVLLASCGSASDQLPTATATATATVTATPAPAPTQPTVTVTATTTEPAPPPPPATTTTTETTTEAPAPPLRPDPDPAPPQDPSPSDSEIRDDVSTAFGASNAYWQGVFSKWVNNAGQPVRWWTPDLYGGDGFYDSTRGQMAGCGDDYDNAENAFFCGDYYSGTGFVAWDMELFRKAPGDGAYYVTVAHEIGHAGQTRFIHDGESGAVPVTDVGQENQADCLAGATLSKAVQDGYLTVEDGDLEEITTFLIDFADGETHGTPEERVGLFHLGYDSADIESCLFNRGVPPPGWFGPR